MKKHKFALLIIAVLIIYAYGSLIDTSPYQNSYQTIYGTQSATTLHKLSAHLSNNTHNIFWFIQITDIHIGSFRLMADTKQNFRDFFNNMKFVLNVNNDSNFIVSTGDLTNAQIPLPYRQDIHEWEEYNNTVYNAGLANTSYYYDIVGNHDGYNDSLSFHYYLTYSIQKKLQYSWYRAFPFGNYTFIALNSVQDTGSSFPDGTLGSLNRMELDWFEQQLIDAQKAAKLTFVFAHHPEDEVGYNTTTSGKTLLDLLEEYNVSAYIYGHGHETHERNQGGTLFIESDSLGMPLTAPGYRIFAVDNDGISTIYHPLNKWPAVLITCPIDRKLTMQAPDIPNNSKSVPVRALVFDENPLSSVQFKLDNGILNPMAIIPDNAHLWNASFDASGLSAGEHTLTVQASSSSGIATDSIVFRVGSPDTPEIVNGPLPSFYRVKNCAPWTLNLSMYTWDRIDESFQLNWSVSGVDSSLYSMMFDPLHASVTFTPVKDAFGSDSMTFTLNNSRGKVTSQTICITLVNRLNPRVSQLYLGIIVIASVIGVVLLNYFMEKRIPQSQNSSKKENPRF
jgi:Icc-related predicted phosphoesterase